MINLLPPALKQDYHFARRNRQLLRWAIAFGAAIAGVIVITFAGIFDMNNSIDNYQSQVDSSKIQLANQHSDTTQKQVADISNNLKLMNKVLSKEVLFSKLLGRLGSITPSGVELTNLSISQAESAIDITAQTSSYTAATQLQTNLAAPGNQIFSKADLVSIDCHSLGAGQNTNYPCTASIRALLLTNNPFLFINANGKSAGKAS